MKWLILLAFFALGTGIEAKDTNKTIVCAFQGISACYVAFTPLGTNFSYPLANTAAALNDTCRKHIGVKICLDAVSAACPINLNKAVQIVDSFVNGICTNKSKEQTTFLNSSKCFNDNIKSSQHCVSQNELINKYDTKSLCCSKINTVKCIKNNLRKNCSKTSTQFGIKMLDTYNSYTQLFCSNYKCDAAKLSSVNIWILGILSVMFGAHKRNM